MNLSAKGLGSISSPAKRKRKKKKGQARKFTQDPIPPRIPMRKMLNEKKSNFKNPVSICIQ